jgi:hypothetical protein
MERLGSHTTTTPSRTSGSWPSRGSSTTTSPTGRPRDSFTLYLSKYIDGLRAPDYSTIDRRANKLEISLDETLINSNVPPVSITIDSSGVKVHNGGDWIRKVWKVKKKGYLKIYFAVDIKTKQVVSMDVSSEKEGP